MKGSKPRLVVDNGVELNADTSPDWMSPEARQEWDRVLPIMSARKVMTDADIGLLENYCVTFGRTRQLERRIQNAGDEVDLRVLRLQDKLIQTCRQLAVEVGLTPSARSKPMFQEPGGKGDAQYDIFASLDL